jgi:hypothetical protein
MRYGEEVEVMQRRAAVVIAWRRRGRGGQTTPCSEGVDLRERVGLRHGERLRLRLQVLHAVSLDLGPVSIPSP